MQRVPVTDSAGKVQTSTATVAVMPEVDEVEVVINMDDVEMKTARSSGAGAIVCDMWRQPTCFARAAPCAERFPFLSLSFSFCPCVVGVSWSQAGKT